MSCTVYVGASVDGFIARENDTFDFLEASDGSGETPGDPNEDYGFAEFMKSIDALVMGRRTFEVVRPFAQWPYGETPVFVWTRRPLDLPPDYPHPVEPVAGLPADVVAQLAQRGLHRLYVDGGRTIQTFLEAGYVDRLVVSRVPVLIGQGISLFGPLSRDVKLEHVATKVWPGGMVRSEYAVVRPAPPPTRTT